MMQNEMVKGQFSGVTLENIADTPILIRSKVFEASAEQMPSFGQGMEVAERESRKVAVTQEGFFIEFEAELESGTYIIATEAGAPNRGTDSYWVDVDGERLKQSLTLRVGAMRESTITVAVDKPGKHTIRVTLREAPGSVIGRIGLYRSSVKISRKPMLDELANAHPRMFFTGSDLEAMRARLQNPRVKNFYKPAGVLNRKPPAFKPGRRNGGAYRSLDTYAMGYLMKPDEEKLRHIIDWLEMSTTYPHCGVDLDAEYFMEGLATTYDWLYNDIPEDLRVRVRDTIARQCREIYQASLNGRTGGGLSFQQNHYWFAHLALTMGAVAVYGEVPEAESWLAWAWDRFERIALTFSPDSGFHEGPSYWDYSMPTLYMYIDLYEQCTGLRVPTADTGLKGQTEFRLRHLYPGMKLSAALEDTGITKGRYSVNLALWEAKRFGDPVVMGMADLMNGEPSSDCWNLLRLDENLASQNPLEALSLSKYYPDIETAFARTSWDDDATAVAFVSRPLGGHSWAELCDKFSLGGTGHNHPEQNHFVLFGAGEVLAGDPGYTYEKKTRNHNTVLVDGQGQYGDGEMWPRPHPGRAHITRFHSEGDITIITGDATSAYPDKIGLKLFERTLVLASPDLVVIHDHLIADVPKDFSWLLHHYGELTFDAGKWKIRRGDAQLTVDVVIPPKFTAEATTYRPQYIHPTRDLTPDEADIGMLELKSGLVQEAVFLVSLSVGHAEKEPPQAQNISTRWCDAVRVGDVVVAFNRRDGSMGVFMPWEENYMTDAKVLVARLDAGKRHIVTVDK